jgi:hypothetical protein
LIAFASGITLLAALAFGGRINFWQAMAISFWAWLPVAVIQKALSLILLFLKAPEDLHPILNADTLLQDNLAILFSPTDHPILFVLASVIGLTSFYSLWLKGKGLHHGGTKVSSTAAWSVAILLWVIPVLLGTIMTALFPSFIS